MPESAGSGAAADSLPAAIERLLGPIRSLCDAAGDAAGTGSRSFVAETSGGVFHVKHVYPGMPRLLSLTEEFALLERLSAGGICPRPVAVDAKAGLIASEQLSDYRSLQASELRQDEMLGSLASLLRRLHESSVDLAVHSFGTIAERYVAEVGGIEALTGIEHDRAIEFLALAKAFDERADAKVVCHGDIVASNVMRGLHRDDAGATGARQQLLLIDFEYAQRAPAVFDLAIVSFMNDFAPSDDVRLLDRYFDGGERPFSPDDFAKVRRLVTLLAHFWARGRPGTVPGVARYALDG